MITTVTKQPSYMTLLSPKRWALANGLKREPSQLRDHVCRNSGRCPHCAGAIVVLPRSKAARSRGSQPARSQIWRRRRQIRCQRHTPGARDGDTERGGRKGAGGTNLLEVVGRDAGEVEPRGGGRETERGYGDGQRRRRRARDRHGNGRSSGGDARSASARGRS
jgi:hypothetical protein